MLNDPVFVNRRTQLRLFENVLTALDHGERRHTALLGLRRIGKTLLLDEVRVRHPDRCIVKLSVDTLVSTPEGFALDVVSALLQEVGRIRGLQRVVTGQPRSIVAAAALLGEDIVPHVEEILDLVDGGAQYGRLLTKVLALPGAVSAALDLPILIILDEFHDLRKLLNYPGTDNLWGAFREALDRRGKVAFTIAGSIVTYLRQILRAGSDPLFSRFDELYLPPFAPEDTHELATGIWDRAGLTWDAEAVERIQTLSQGYPFYVHTLARAAGDLALTLDHRVDRDCVAIAFQQLILDRDSALAIYLQYLHTQAISDVRGENVPDAVMRFLARHEWSTLSDIARGTRRSIGQVRDSATGLMAIDVLTRRADAKIGFVDPLLPVWLATERDRQEVLPRGASDPAPRARVMEVISERLKAAQDTLGLLFEKQVQNIIRQFRGQRVPARLFGAGDEELVLPTIRDVRSLDLPDPRGSFGGAPGSVEIDGVTDGSELWLVEAKHRRGGVTSAQVERFLKKCGFYEESTGGSIDRRWIVSDSGFRADARARCEAEGVYYTDARRLRQLERVLIQ